MRVQHTQNTLGSVLAAPGPSCGAWKDPAQPWKRQAAPWSTPCTGSAAAAYSHKEMQGLDLLLKPSPIPCQA